MDKVKSYARFLRNNPTQAERYFWDLVKQRQFLKLRFVRQYIFSHKEMNDVIHYFIVDFYCHELKMIVEIDGGYHDNPDQIELDNLRTDILKIKGLRLIRFSNDDVINNQKEVAQRLKEFVKDIDDGKFESVP